MIGGFGKQLNGSHMHRLLASPKHPTSVVSSQHLPAHGLKSVMLVRQQYGDGAATGGGTTGIVGAAPPGATGVAGATGVVGAGTMGRYGEPGDGTIGIVFGGAGIGTGTTLFGLPVIGGTGKTRLRLLNDCGRVLGQNGPRHVNAAPGYRSMPGINITSAPWHESGSPKHDNVPTADPNLISRLPLHASFP